MSDETVDPLRETLIERRSIHQGRLLHVFDDRVRLEDGRSTQREVVEHPGAVCIVAVDGEGRVAMVRQWRHPARRALWELPAGTRDRAGEPPETTASRELGEEMGAAASSWQSLGVWPLAPGYSSEVMHFYLAQGISAVPGEADPDEQLERSWCAPEEAERRIRSGEVDVKTVAGLAVAGFPVATLPDAAPAGADG